MKFIEVMCGDLLNVEEIKRVCFRKDADNPSRYKSYVIDKDMAPYEFIVLLPNVIIRDQEIELKEVHLTKLLMYAMDHIGSSTCITLGNEYIERAAYESLEADLRMSLPPKATKQTDLR